MAVRGEGRRCETPDVLYKGCNLTLLNNTDNSSRGKLKQQGSLSPSLSAFVMDEIATKSLSLSMYIYNSLRNDEASRVPTKWVSSVVGKEEAKQFPRRATSFKIYENQSPLPL